VSSSSVVSDENVEKLVCSTCPYCGVGCGVDIVTQNQRAISLSGSQEHPANQGRLCVKGTHLLDTVDHTNRLLHPEVNGEQVTWSKAISEVASGFQSIIEEHGKDAVAFYVSGQLLTEDYYVANKLMKGYIGSANIDTNSRLCMSSAVSAYKRAFGEDIVPGNYQDIEQTDLLVLMGSNAAWTHPVLFQRIERARKINPNYKVVVVDPRATATSIGADLHLAIKPGADAALYNGLLWYLVEQGAADFDYIEQHSLGFNETIDAAQKWNIDTVATFCGLNRDDVEAFYRLFSTSDKAVSLYSMGINQSSSGVDKCHAIINVHLATGKIGHQGCGPFSMTGQPNAMGGREVGGLANQLTAHLELENPAHRQLVKEFWQSPTVAEQEGAKTLDMFEKMRQGKIKAVWIMATNPLVSLPNHEKIKEAMAACELVVVSDCVDNNDTLAFADIKLPAAGWLEKDGTVTNSERRISRQRAVQKPAGTAKADWQIISEVAQCMGFSGFNYQTSHQIFTEFAQLSGFENDGENTRVFNLSGLENLSLNEYDKLMPIQWPVTKNCPYGSQRLFGDGQYATASRKAQFFAIEPQLPVQKTSNEYPFNLNSGRIRDQWHSMTRTARSSVLNKHTTKPYLLINSKDAYQLGLEDEEIVRVDSINGSITVPVKISSDVMEKQCFVPIHWNKQFASNATVSSIYGCVVDPISGQPEVKQVAVSITKTDFSSFGEIYCRTPIMFDSDYWLKSKNDGIHYYQLADRKVISYQALKAKLISELNVEGEWISKIDLTSNGFNFLCLDKGEVVVAGYFKTTPVMFAYDWIFALFNSNAVDFEQVSQLLNQDSRQDQASSRQICSCFNVKQSEILQAIEQGADSVSALGSSLKCGTNCGSCKPELQSLINQTKLELTELAEEVVI